MDIKELKELIQLVDSSDLALFELKQGEISIRMDKSLTRGFSEKVEESLTNTILKTSEEVKVKEEIVIEKVSTNAVEVNEEDLYSVTSPMVGTFYGAPAPGKPAFVTEGTKVAPGQILCIIEAMKLMNEIENEVNGEIVKVLVKDGDMVEYGQTLFKIRRG